MEIKDFAVEQWMNEWETLSGACFESFSTWVPTDALG